MSRGEQLIVVALLSFLTGMALTGAAFYAGTNCEHRWSKWTKAQCDGRGIYQSRICPKCNLTQARHAYHE